MEIEWHPINSDKDLPRVGKRVLISSGRSVDIEDGRLKGETTKDWYWRDVIAWAEVPKPYKKPKK